VGAGPGSHWVTSNGGLNPLTSLGTPMGVAIPFKAFYNNIYSPIHWLGAYKETHYLHNHNL